MTSQQISSDPCVSLSLIILCILIILVFYTFVFFLYRPDAFPSGFHSDSWRKGTLHIFHNIIFALLNKCAFSMPSDTHVYNALVCDQKLSLEPRSHVLHLQLLQVKVTLLTVFSPCGGLIAVGLPQAGAAPCGVHS